MEAGSQRMLGVRRLKEVPRQGWLLRHKDGRLTGICGKRVVGGRDWLYEGGWAETDTPRSLSLSGVYLGSGAVWDGTRLSLIAPSHTADAVYVMQRPGELLASNSLPFLIAGAKISDFPILEARQPMRSLKGGIDSHVRLIHSGPSGNFYRFFNAIVTYKSTTGLKEEQQSADPYFETFEDYRAYLMATIRQAAQSYGSTGTAVFVSRGYDSVACAALAAEFDPKCMAICVDQSRKGVPDDGTEVAKALGIQSVLLKRRMRPKKMIGGTPCERVSPDEVEEICEFYLGMGLYDECLKAPPELLADRMVLTGFHGDDLWDLEAKPSRDLRRADLAGASLGEFRIRVGFLHVPVPMLAFKANPKIQEIAHSDAMRPWRTEFEYYNRPIPRRIAEEAGVPREHFGHWPKQAVATEAIFGVGVGTRSFRLQTARYEPAARALNPPVRRLVSMIARRGQSQ